MGVGWHSFILPFLNPSFVLPKGRGKLTNLPPPPSPLPTTPTHPLQGCLLWRAALAGLWLHQWRAHHLGHGHGGDPAQDERGGGVIKLAWIPTTSFLVASTAHGLVKVLDARDGSTKADFTGHAGMVLDFKVSGRAIVTGGDDGVARVFDTTGF